MPEKFKLKDYDDTSFDKPKDFSGIDNPVAVTSASTETLPVVASAVEVSAPEIRNSILERATNGELTSGTERIFKKTTDAIASRWTKTGEFIKNLGTKNPKLAEVPKRIDMDRENFSKNLPALIDVPAAEAIVATDMAESASSTEEARVSAETFSHNPTLEAMTDGRAKVAKGIEKTTKLAAEGDFVSKMLAKFTNILFGKNIQKKKVEALKKQQMETASSPEAATDPALTERVRVLEETIQNLQGMMAAQDLMYVISLGMGGGVGSIPEIVTSIPSSVIEAPDESHIIDAEFEDVVPEPVPAISAPDTIPSEADFQEMISNAASMYQAGPDSVPAVETASVASTPEIAVENAAEPVAANDTEGVTETTRLAA